jgi:hypothetical protein
MFDFTAIFVVGFCVLGTYKLFELYAKRKERILMIEKLLFLCENKGDKEEQLKIRLPFISRNDFDFGFWPLRISLLVIGIGIGCLIAFFIQSFLIYEAHVELSNYWDWYRQVKNLIVLLNFASISIFGGIGLLIAFLIEQKMKKTKTKED